MWPGALSNFWTYRSELRSSWRELAVLAIPSLAGGIFAAVLLKTANAAYAAIVPYWIFLVGYSRLIVSLSRTYPDNGRETADFSERPQAS